MWKEKQREIGRYYIGDFEDDGGNGKSMTCSAALQARTTSQNIGKKSKNKQMGLKLISFFRAKETINK